jgi:hypothetical protein
MRSEHNRRAFLERMALGAATLAGWSTMGPGSELLLAAAPSAPEDDFDFTWPDRIKGSHRCVFDATEMEDGAGLLRASIWKMQYGKFLQATPEDLGAVLVIRHSAIPLAMTQDFWDKYQIGKAKKVKHPFTEEPTRRNPNLLSAEKGELPPDLAALNLDGFQKGGGIVLACNLAFSECVRTIAKADKVDEGEARKRAVAMMVPGVLLQPSGVFAAIRAQEAGCQYLKAS